METIYCPSTEASWGKRFHFSEEKNFHFSIFQLSQFKAPETDPPLAMDGGNDGKGGGKAGENTNTG